MPQPPAPAEAKAGGSGPVSASATVPVANRLTPPADFAAPVTAAPQSRVYGRPVAEPAAEPQPYGHLPPASQPPQPPSHSAAPQPSPASGPGAPQSMPHPGWSPVAGTATPPQSHPAPGAAASASSAPFLPPQPQPAEPNWNASPEQWGNPSAGPDHASPAGPAWGPPPADDQERFNAFAAQQATEPATEEEAPPPQVRNGRVLLAVLGAAIAILAIPLGTLYLLGMIGSSSEAFNPAVGACVKQSGDSAAPADCAEPGAYSVVSKVDDVTKCADPNQPYIAVPLNGKEQILCLQPAGEPDAPAAGDPEPSASE
ncbi:MAG TPA: hypothetical protein VF174_02030 [Micromonosporaceae bacterium]